MSDEKSIYNIIVVKNIDTEDFIFAVDKEEYFIGSGTQRRLPKFMAHLAVKHLIDKILQRQNPDGTTLSNIAKRQELAARIIVAEETLDRPAIPTNRQVVEQMNKVSDLEAGLAARSKKPEVETTSNEDVVLDDSFDGLKEAPAAKISKKVVSVKKPKSKLPPREEMISYAKNVLKLEVEDPKTKVAFEKMSDQELFDELQMEVA